MKKRISTIIVAVFMAVLLAVQMPLQAFAAATDGDYISEIKVFMAKKEADAKSALANEGYTLLDCNLNQDAEGGTMSKGKKATYIGYKTTNDSKEAITDLAVMNMKGGYSTEDYDALMEKYISGDVTPFVDCFLAAVEEYRENYTSDIEENQKRAQYSHDVLNTFTDDDCGGAGLGDLLLNKTKYELGDDAYNKLSDDEKKNHADLVTIVAQSNGKAEQMMENMITRASDTNEDTWLDRLSVTTYDDLVEETGETPTDAKKTLAKQYDDDANTLLDMWDDFKEALEGKDEALEAFENYDTTALEEAKAAVEALDENASDEEKEDALVAYYEARFDYLEMLFNFQIVAIYEALEKMDYDDGTLLDFFLQDSEDIEDDITVIYPMVASLTDGQRAGLEFVSIRELASMAVTPSEGYENVDPSEMNAISIYDGVDREIYDKGGVGLTSDAQRTDALKEKTSKDYNVSGWSIAAYTITGASLVAAISSAIVSKAVKNTKTYQTVVETLEDDVDDAYRWGWFDDELGNPMPSSGLGREYNINDMVNKAAQTTDSAEAATYNTINTTSSYAKAISIGCSIAVIVMSIVSIYLTFKDMYDYYQVEFTPQPRYMVDETDIIGYNKKGEKIVLKNQSAYYKIVQTNRDSKAEYYKTLGTGNDLNGDVGQQWLTLYAVKMEGHDPILASSLKSVVNSSEIPSGYETGIHFFGEDNAYNLNNTKFVWDDDAPSIFVYYKTDDTATTLGTSQTIGRFALVGGACLIIGAGLGIICTNFARKRKSNAAQPA